MSVTVTRPLVVCPICSSAARFMGDHPEASLFRCATCSHCFSVPNSPNKAEEYGDGYFEDEHRRWFENPNFWLFDRIARIIPGDGCTRRVLDVGCGRGDFLRYIARCRPDLQLTGIDLAAAPPAEGIRFLKGDILTTKIDERFDVVVCLAVIEHVGDIRTFAERLIELTRPGGYVCVMTVNEASVLYWLARTLRRAGFTLAFDRLYSKHHLHHFTAKSLARLFDRPELNLQTAYLHNGLLAATDVPASSAAIAHALRVGVAGVMAVGWLLRRMYLQTVVYQKLPAVQLSHFPAYDLGSETQCRSEGPGPTEGRPVARRPPAPIRPLHG